MRQSTANRSTKPPTSSSDPEVRILVQPGKARALNYLCSVAVDTATRLISPVQASFANSRDSVSAPTSRAATDTLDGAVDYMPAFTLTSCLCGIAPSIAQLIGYRFLQGVSAAAMLPQTIALIQVSFTEPQARNRAFGYYGITLGLASMLGQLLGGYLVGTDWGWRLTFLVNLPIGLVAIGAAFRLLPETPRNQAQHFDVGGVVLLTTSLGTLLYPLSVGRELGWPAWSLGLLLLGAVLLGWFWRQQGALRRRGGNPLLDVCLFRYPSFNLGLGTLVFIFQRA